MAAAMGMIRPCAEATARIKWTSRSSWATRTPPVLGRAPSRRRGPSDRVLWVAVTEALERARGLDASDIEVQVEDREVTLNGTVRRREDKRRAEDLADLHEVENVQNNLRVRRHLSFGF
jgi:hypothetical protein